MSLGDVAGLIAAIAFVILVGFLAYPLIRMGKMFDQIAQTVKETGDHAVPAIDEGVTTVQRVNKSLEDVNDVSDALSTTASNVSALTDLYGSVLGKPMVKVASTVWAVRQTVGDFFKGGKSGAKTTVDGTVASDAAKASASASDTKTSAPKASAAKASTSKPAAKSTGTGTTPKAGE
ncbi:MAG: DUF948 domain-containing protein [Bifidobacteriaceae bacterium]|nr:DUF948 domain-containing protein [Bifidobacteriaceae bacterium]